MSQAVQCGGRGSGARATLFGAGEEFLRHFFERNYNGCCTVQCTPLTFESGHFPRARAGCQCLALAAVAQWAVRRRAANGRARARQNTTVRA